MCLLQVTIRASLTGKAPSLPSSPGQSGVTVSPDNVGHQAFKSKRNVAGVTKANQESKKPNRITDRHNLALRHLRLFTQFSYSSQKHCNSIYLPFHKEQRHTKQIVV